ncbi:MAG: hypothetical protein FJ312_00345 [SAR202 cluster bacterium]|nr:hypothetical protein [SAR202 cluster bacterium]
MLDVLWWLITAEAIGLAAFPIAYLLLSRLKDRGYSVSKPLGILLVGYVSWILSTAHILPSVRLGVVAVLLVMGGGSAWLFWRNRSEMLKFIAREKTIILATEAVFILALIGWASYRALDPYINHTEQPMDFAFLNASVRTVWAPPEDPWLSGHAISYYYFGYWLMAGVTKLTGVAPAIAYNLSLALVPALASAAVLGLVYNLVREEKGGVRVALGCGLLAAVLLGVAANLHGILEFMWANGIGTPGFWTWVGIDGMNNPAQLTQEWRPTEFWWWWRATRVINTFDGGQGLDYTITEFPFFSFMLGDLHPHVVSLAFIPLFIAVCFNFLLSPLPRLAEPSLRTYLSILALGFVLGGLGFVNAWDLPIFAVLFLGIAGLKTYSAHGRDLRRATFAVAPIAVVVIGLSLLLYLPYLATFESQFTGLYPVKVTTRPFHLIIVWGVAFVVVAPFVVSAFWGTAVRKGWGWMARLAALLVLVPFVAWAILYLLDDGNAGDLVGRFFHVLPLLLLAGLAVYTVLWLMERPGKARTAGTLRFAYRRHGEDVDWPATVGGLSEAARKLGIGVLWVRDSGGEGYVELGLRPPRGMSTRKAAAALAAAVEQGPLKPEMREEAGEVAVPSGKVFALVLAALGLALIMVPELLYVGDFFNTRMNTMFKLYYQAWVLLALAGGFTLYYWHSQRGGASGWKRTLSNLWAVVAVAVLVAALYYPFAAAASKAELKRSTATLNGLAHVAGESGGEVEAVRYLRENAGEDTVMLEAVGGPYTAFGRVSSSTGVPTVLGWPGHELQWRGDDKAFQGREADVATVYSTTDAEEAKNLLDKYGVEYVYVGPREKEKYGVPGTFKFATFMERVVSSGDGVELYYRARDTQ